MKNTNFIKKHWKKILICPTVLLLMIVSAVSLFNYLLVPPELATIIETVMYDIKHEDENIDIAFVGSSRTYTGIDSVSLSEYLDKNVYNIAYESSDYFTTYHILEEVEKTHDLKEIFLEVSIPNFSRKKGTQEIYVHRTLTGETKKSFAEGKNIDYINFKPLEFTHYLKNFSNGRFVENISLKAKKDISSGYAINDKKTTYVGNGYITVNAKIDSESNLVLPKSYGGESKSWNKDNLNELQVEYFHKIIKMCEDKDIKVTLYSPPYPAFIVEKYLDKLEAFNNYIEEINQNYNFEYIDFSKLLKSQLQLTNNYFYNSNHLNVYGSKKFQPIITSVYNDLKNNTYNASNYFYDSYDDMISAYNA